MDGSPTPEMLEAFAAMDRFTEELVKAGVFVAAAGLKNTPDAKRIVFDGSQEGAAAFVLGSALFEYPYNRRPLRVARVSIAKVINR